MAVATQSERAERFRKSVERLARLIHHSEVSIASLRRKRRKAQPRENHGIHLEIAKHHERIAGCRGMINDLRHIRALGESA